MTLGPFLDAHQAHGDLHVLTREDGIEASCDMCKVVWTHKHTTIHPTMMYVSREMDGDVVDF